MSAPISVPVTAPPSISFSTNTSPVSSLPTTPLWPTTERTLSISSVGWSHVSTKTLHLAPVPYVPPKIDSYFYREDDMPDGLDDEECPQTLFPPPPHTTISGPPSTIGLCNGRTGDKKNSGNLCALEYFGTEQRCFYCGRNLK